MNSLTVRELFDQGERLGIRQIVEPPDLWRAVNHVLIYQREMGGKSYSPIFSRTVVLFPSAIWGRYRSRSPMESSSPLASGNISCTAFCEARRWSDLLLRFSEKTGIPVFSSSYDPILLKSRLTGLLTEKCARTATVHGVFVTISGIGILLMGRNGIGKTLCGLEIVSRGGFFIADDAVVLEAEKDVILGRGHVRTKRLIALRSGKILRAEELVGKDRIREHAAVHGIVQFIGNSSPAEAGAHRRQQGNRTFCRLVGVDLPCRYLVSDGDPRHMADAVLNIVGEFKASRNQKGLPSAGGVPEAGA